MDESCIMPWPLRSLLGQATLFEFSGKLKESFRAARSRNDEKRVVVRREATEQVGPKRARNAKIGKSPSFVRESACGLSASADFRFNQLRPDRQRICEYIPPLPPLSTTLLADYCLPNDICHINE